MKEGWEVKKLTDVCHIQYGYAFDSSCFCDDDSYPQLIRIRDVVRGYSETFYNGNIPEGYFVYKGDYLIGMDGEFHIAPWQSEKALLNQRVCKISASDCDVDERFIYYTMSVVLKQIEDETPFVTVKHLSAKRLNLVKIPIPPLPEQFRIVEELDQLSNIIEKKRQQLSELDNLAQSIFYDMFGDPVTNEKGWEVKKLGEVGFFARGVSKHRPRNAPALLGGSMPLIQTGDVANSGMYITDYNSTYSELGVQQSKVWEAGTLCITIAATIGKCSILTFDACFPDSVVGYIGKKEFICNEYVYYLFGCLQSILEANAPAVAQKNINLKVLNLLEVPLPPLELQQFFAQKIEAIEKEKELIKQSIKETEELFNSRMDYYFN